MLGTLKNRTISLHSQSDETVEVSNTTLEDFSKVVASHQRDWYRHLQVSLMAY